MTPPDPLRVNYQFQKARADKAEAERDRLREALDFYADGWKWMAPEGRKQLLTDAGQVARDALATAKTPKQASE